MCFKYANIENLININMIILTKKILVIVIGFDWKYKNCNTMNSFRIFGILFFVGFSWAQQETAKDIVILPSRIPRPVCTKLNEVYFTNPTPCPQDCANLNQECLIKSLALPGCFCPEGFVRNENNDCVEGNSYCGKCDVNEYYSESGPACEECEYVGKECDRQTFAIPRGCFCIEGYARDDNYKCIPVEQCQGKFGFIFLIIYYNIN